MTAGNDFSYTADFATTKLKPAAVITAPEVDLAVLYFVGVNSSGNTFVSAAEKGTDVSQIITNDLEIEGARAAWMRRLRVIPTGC